jgi:hypothetical protein
MADRRRRSTMMMLDMDPYVAAERGTALAWVALALLGVFRRVRRLQRLDQIILPEPLVQEDADYLASVKRSTHLRLGVKLVLLGGGMIALFQAFEYLLFWRVGIIAALVLMDAETVNVDSVRLRLALRARAMSDDQAQRDRIEAAGEETGERLRREGIGDQQP